MRIVVVVAKSGETWQMPFDGENITDTKALAVLLTVIDTGDDYHVFFNNSRCVDCHAEVSYSSKYDEIRCPNLNQFDKHI